MSSDDECERAWSALKMGSALDKMRDAADRAHVTYLNACIRVEEHRLLAPWFYLCLGAIVVSALLLALTGGSR